VTWITIRALNRLSAVLGLKATTHSYSGSRNVHLLTFCSSGNYSDTVVRLKSSRISRCIVMSLMHYIIWFPFSLRCLLADSEAYSIIISDCCLDIVKLFSNRYSSYSFSLILYVSVNTQKNCGTDFRNFDFKIFGEFLSRVSILTRDIDIAILFVRLSVCPSRSGILWKRLNILS